MTKSTITRERIQRIIRAINSEAYDEEEIREWLSSDEIMELSRMALAAMDGEPDCNERNLFCSTDTARMRKVISVSAGIEGAPLYRHAQPAPDREQIRNDHAEWSQSTFGNVGPIGPLKHLSKEALEAAADPSDLSEWADMQFLLWDAQRRAGITDEQITQAMIEKLAVNKQREWPAPKDGEPRLHIKTQPAPVVPPEQHWEELCRQHPDMSIGDAIIRAAWWNHCRAAMLHAGTLTNEGTIQAVNSPVIPGWIPVSERMPEREVDVQVYCPDKKEQMVAYLERNELEGYFRFATWRTGEGIYCQPTHWMPLPAGPQEVR
ncbi:TPA: dATP/dGTP pyrophosphohydrolase domain-containing protein [Klebsiella pneumoniae]